MENELPLRYIEILDIIESRGATYLSKIEQQKRKKGEWIQYSYIGKIAKELEKRGLIKKGDLEGTKKFLTITENGKELLKSLKNKEKIK